MFKQHKKITALFVMAFLLLFTITGCGIFGPKEIDPPQVEYTMKDMNDPLMGIEGQLGEEVTLSSKVVYLLDANGFVVPVTMKIPYSESIAQQVLKYMVQGGPVDEMMPMGFTAPLPEGTTFTMNINEGVATVDFSREFKNYDAANEQAILDAITWSLTEFSTIQQVKISINGDPIDKMPVAGTPVNSLLSRANGINLEMSAGAMPGKTTAVTLYFEGKDPSGEYQYFVPITRLIPMTNDVTTATLEELIKGPKAGKELVYSILPSTQVNRTSIENGTAIADFDEMILGIGGTELSSHTSSRGLESVVRSLAATKGVTKVQIMVNGKAELMTDSMDYTQPVTVPKQINAITS